MVKAKSFTLKGVAEPEFSLPKEFGEKVNASLIAQAIRVLSARSHTGFSKVKTRAEINRTKKKLYKQKGTGGARHGSRRAPIFVGGGIAHGPKVEKRIFSLPKRLKVMGRNSVLSLKVNLGEVVMVSGIEKIAKTKEAQGFLNAISKEFTKAKRFTFILSEKSSKAKKGLANIKNAKVIFYKNANALDLYNGGLLILDKTLFAEEKAEKKAASRKVSKK